MSRRERASRSRPGAGNAEVAIELTGGQQVISLTTQKSVTELGLAPRRAVYAVSRASRVMLGVDHSYSGRGRP